MPQGWGVDSKGLVRNHVKIRGYQAMLRLAKTRLLQSKSKSFHIFTFFSFIPVFISARQVSSSSEEVFYGPVYP